MEFVYRFPHLDDLALINPRGLQDGVQFPDPPPRSKRPRPQRPLPFGGQLFLGGAGPLVQCLLDLPDGIHFHSIEVKTHLRDLAKLPVACSSTLEVLKIICAKGGKPRTLTLASRFTEGSLVTL